MEEDVFRKNGFSLGRMISGSKSGYNTRHPNNKVVFNANIFTEDGKIWFGDLDITLDRAKLEEVAKELKKDLYVLREHAGRFENENLPFEKVKKVAVEIIKC